MVSESQERMLCVVEPARVPDVLALCERWEIHGTAIGTVTDTRRMRVFDGPELVGDMPVSALVDDCPLYDLAPARPATPIYAPPPATLALRRLCARVSARAPRPPRTSPPAAPCSSSTTRSSSRAPSAAPSRPTPPCSRCPIRKSRSRSRSTATAAASPPTPTAARSRRCSSAPPTSPASAPSRWARPTTSTSATPRSRTSPGSSPNPCAASATPAARCRRRSSAATSPSTTRPPPARSTRRPSSAWSAACPTPAAPVAWALPARATRSRSSVPSPLRSTRASWPSCAVTRSPTSCRTIDIAAVRSAQFAVRGAVRVGGLSSAHDIAEGGLAVALAECCLAGGLGAEVRLDELLSRRGRRGRGWRRSRSVDVLFGEGSGGFVVSGIPTGVRALGRRTTVRVLGDGRAARSCASTSASSSLTATLAELARGARRARGPVLMSEAASLWM